MALRTQSLLLPDEPAAATLVEPAECRFPVLLVCDHASCRLPRRLGDLGLDAARLHSHIAWDIGAGAVAGGLAVRLGLPLVRHEYSRLAIDCNRGLDDPTLVPAVSGGVTIPGNRLLDPQARQLRIDSLFHPYHGMIASRLAAFDCPAPGIIAIHSFTPELAGQRRPWQFGVLWDRDPRIARPLVATMRDRGRVPVGDNEPYSGRHPADYTMDHHGEAGGLPHVSIEIRQDLITDAAGVDRCVAMLAQALEPILDDRSLYLERMKHD